MVERTKEIVAGKLAAKIRVAMAQAGRKITSGVTALATTPATSKEEASLAGAILGVLIRLHTTEGWAKYLRVNGAMAAVMDLQDTGRATAPLLTVDIRERTGHRIMAAITRGQAIELIAVKAWRANAIGSNAPATRCRPGSETKVPSVAVAWTRFVKESFAVAVRKVIDVQTSASRKMLTIV